MTTLGFDDLVGLDLDHPRRRRFSEQLVGLPLDRPVLSSGLAIFRRLPEPERPTLTRTRMAAAIADLVANTGRVTYDDLRAAGFTGEEITIHFSDARRAARVERMAV